MRKIIFIFILSLYSIKSESTPQKPDTLLFNGQSFLLYSYMLEPYFASHPHMRPESNFKSTALARQYIATFKIIDNKLFVVDIEIEIWNINLNYKREKKSVFQDVFPENKPFYIDWFTGDLRAQCFKHKFLSRKSLIPDDNKYLLLHFEKGILKTHQIIKGDFYKAKRLGKDVIN
jgi:hypothetical protein